MQPCEGIYRCKTAFKDVSPPGWECEWGGVFENSWGVMQIWSQNNDVTHLCNPPSLLLITPVLCARPPLLYLSIHLTNIAVLSLLSLLNEWHLQQFNCTLLTIDFVFMLKTFFFSYVLILFFKIYLILLIIIGLHQQTSLKTYRSTHLYQWHDLT